MSQRVARTRQLPNGQIQALSSGGSFIYNVTLGLATRCDCPAGAEGRRCYHVATAINRYAAFYAVPRRFRPARAAAQEVA